MRSLTTANGKEIQISPCHRFVIFTDKSMSGWGEAFNKLNKVVIICDNWHQADRLQDALCNCCHKHSFKYINANKNLPYFNPKRYRVSVYEYSEWNHALWMRYTNIPE